MKRKRNTARAFTLVEILVVIAILAMMAVIFAPRWRKGFTKAKTGLARTKMANIENAMGRFYLDCGRYPAEDEGLEALFEAPAELEEKWNGPYLKQSELVDPWLNPYVYIEQGEINTDSFDLISFGADGQQGGEGENADIVNE
jgi:general secretion pathway protein G